MSAYKGILIIAEQYLGEIHKVSYELLNKGKQLAVELGVSLNCLLLAPEGVDSAQLNYRGAETVYHMKSDVFSLPEEVLFKENIVGFINEKKPEVVLIGATNFGRSVAPRVAAALKTGLTADCTDLTIDEEGRLVQIRPAFSDNLFAHIKTIRNPQMATVRYKEFKEAEKNECLCKNVIEVPLIYKANGKSAIEKMVSLGDVDITEAQVIVAGGRGIKKKEDIELLEGLAQVIGGRVAVSRALVDAGMASSAQQVGYSGNRVKPKVYIACGISGAPQHLAGMKESGLIIAVNSDPSAPIFKIADYGFVGDLYEVVPELTKQWSRG